MSAPLPGIAGCRALLREHGLAENIIAHQEAVARVARFLAQRLVQAGETVDLDLVEQGALLHDLDKLLTLGSAERHGQLAASVLRERGHVEIAEIVERHNLSPRFATFDGWSWEQRLVHYADKLCLGDRVITLDERMADLSVRYPQSAQVIDRWKPLEEALQQEIMSRLGLRPDDLVAMLNE